VVGVRDDDTDTPPALIVDECGRRVNELATATSSCPTTYPECRGHDWIEHHEPAQSQPRPASLLCLQFIVESQALRDNADDERRQERDEQGQWTDLDSAALVHDPADDDERAKPKQRPEDLHQNASRLVAAARSVTGIV
jgi:hypothetical protein